MSIFKRRPVPRDRLTAVYPYRGGIAIASVRREEGVPPVLELCRYHRLDSADDRDKALKTVIKSQRFNNSRCATVMEPHSYDLLQVDAPDVEKDEIQSAVRWRIKDLVDLDIEDAVLDVFDTPAPRTVGEVKKLYVVVARQTDVKARIDALSAGGVPLEIVDIPELALLNIACLLPEDVGGAAVVYIGQEVGIVNITFRGVLYLSRDIQFGTDSLPTTAIHAGDADTVNKWLDDIIIEIQRSLDYYESHYGQSRIAGVVVIPTDPEIPGIVDYLNDQMGLPTRILDVNELLDVPEELDMATQARCILAIGAALREEVAEDATAD
ncbi:MAG: hypothetical protein WD356_00050 [Pseudomonadales bacterium]